MARKRSTNKNMAIALIIALLAFVVWAMLPYVKAVFGAIIFYVLFRPLYGWFVKKGVKKGISAFLVICCSILIILIPLFLVLSLVVGEVGTVMDGARGLVDNVANLDEMLENVSITQMAEDTITMIGNFTKGLLVSGFSKAGALMVSMTIMFFLFYFMLVNHKTVTRAVKAVIPFNNKNKDRLLTEGQNVTYSVVMTTGVIAAMQGFMVGIGFYFAGIPGAVLWGIVAGVLSFLPVVGTPVVWGPAVAILLIQGNYFGGIGLLVWGLIIMNIDNIIRPMLQKKVAEMHPLVSIIGVFIGLPTFGLLGLIMGPLILSYLILTVQMFREEYL